MKKTICILLTLLLTAAFIACGNENEPDASKDILDISNTSDASENTESNSFWENPDNASLVVYPSDYKDNLMTLSENDTKTILGHLNSITDWRDGICKCMGDYTFEVTENGKITNYNYSADDGHLNDSTNQRSYNFEESVREEITNILFLAHPIGEVLQPDETSDKSTESSVDKTNSNEYFETDTRTSRVLFSEISHGDGVGGLILTLKADAEYIINLLKNGKWTNGLHKCITDVWVGVEGAEYEYSSECGCFLDKENGRTLEIARDSRTHIHLNAIFGVFVDKMKLTVHPAYNEGITIRVSEADYDELLTLVLCADWKEGTTDCAADYIFEIDEGGWITKYGYHTSCGTLNNYTDQLSYKLSDSDREEINRILETTPKDLEE